MSGSWNTTTVKSPINASLVELIDDESATDARPHIAVYTAAHVLLFKYPLKAPPSGTVSGDSIDMHFDPDAKVKALAAGTAAYGKFMRGDNAVLYADLECELGGTEVPMKITMSQLNVIKNAPIEAVSFSIV